MARLIAMVPVSGCRRRGFAGLGAIAPADTLPRPDYRGADVERVAQQNVIAPPSQIVPAVTPPPSSGASYQQLAPWQFPPFNAEPFDPCVYVALGNQGTTTTILTLRVPDGRHGVIAKFGNQDFGAGWTQGTGDLIWRILINGAAARNYENIRASLGNVANPTDLGLRLYENDLVEVIVVNAAAPAGIPGNPIVSARLHGWFWPKVDDQEGWSNG